MDFADGAVSESAYKLKLKRLQKEESELIKCRGNIDPAELGEMISLGISIDMVKGALKKGSLLVTDSGISGQIDDIFRALEFNVSTEHNGGDNPHGFEMTDVVLRAMDTPDFQKGDNPGEKEEAMKRTQRALLQKFSIKVIVYPERVEIKGMIPTQILDKTEKEETAPIITSA